MNPAVLSGYLRDSLRILQANLELALGPEPACYRAVAGQLRLLLCDTTRRHGRIEDISLAVRCLPDLRLPPLEGAGNTAWLDRQAWLAQAVSLPSGETTCMKDVIRLACDRDGGAHVDPAGGPVPDTRALILAAGRAALEGIGQSADWEAYPGKSG